MQEITSRKNPLVRHLKKLGADRAYRDACGEFLCDGLKLYEEAVQCGMDIPLLAGSRREIVEKANGQGILVPEDVLSSISPQKSPQPVVFSCKKPEAVPVSAPQCVLILDGIQDPGNVGTLIRTAEAFCADQVIVTGNSADIYHPKTVRAAMGALFRQAVCEMDLEELLNYVNQNKLTLLGAALAEDGRMAGGPLPKPAAIAIGSEGQGLSPDLLAHCHETIYIPMNPATESLNAGVAGAILLWEVSKNRL